MSVNKGTLEYECPSNWGLDKLIEKSPSGRDFHAFAGQIEEETDILLLKVMSVLLDMHEAVVFEDQEKISIKIEQLDDMMPALLDEYFEIQGISEKVVDHVIASSKYHALKALGLEVKSKVAKSDIEPLCDLDDIDIATLKGLQSIAFGRYSRMDNMRPLILAKLAVAKNPHCALWHSNLAMNLRWQRRSGDYYFSLLPGQDELEALLKAYQFSKNSTFGIQLVHCFKDLRKHEEAKQLLYQVFDLETKCCYSHLRIAKAFMIYGDLEKAKKCLDIVESKYPNNSMFQHYKGMYLTKKNENLEEAGHLFKLAAEDGNFPAAMSYVQHCEKMNTGVNVVEFLISFKQRHQLNEQVLALHIAMFSHLKYDDFENALKYFQKAIEIDPDNEILKTYKFNLVIPHRISNLFKFLQQQFFPEIKSRLYKLSVQTKNIQDNVLNLVSISDFRGRNYRSLDGNDYSTHPRNMRGGFRYNPNMRRNIDENGARVLGSRENYENDDRDLRRKIRRTEYLKNSKPHGRKRECEKGAKENEEKEDGGSSLKKTRLV